MKKYAALLIAVAACSEAPQAPTAQPMPQAPSMSAGTGAHFMSVSASVDGSGNLIVSFREAGLGNAPVSTVHVEVSGNATATYACINGGGNHPKAANKEDVNGPISGSGDFGITKNGSAVGSVTVAPPPSTLVCPGGQRFVLADVDFFGLSITDTTDNVFLAIAGDFLRTFFNLN